MMKKRVLLAIGSVVGGLVVAVAVQAPAIASPSPLVSESFTSNTTNSPNWVLPAPTSLQTNTTAETNDACLTGRTANDSVPSPIPACATPGTTPGLQLTIADPNAREGAVAYSSSVPSKLGLDVTFNTYQYDSSGAGADGIAFFLAASDPTNASSSPITLGPPGGYLGYSTNSSAGANGLTRGYLGVGLDVYGNFTNSAFANSDCEEKLGATPQSVTVRGPGNAAAGYCMITTSTVGGGTLDTQTGQQAQPVPVEVAVNPTDNPLSAADGLLVPARSYVVQVSPIGASPVVESDALPSAVGDTPDDATWLDAHGVPVQLSFGWSASTGAVNDYHTISSVNVAPLTGTPPTLSVSLSDNSGGAVHNGQKFNYSAVTSVTAATETQPITLTDTLPAGLVPQLAGLGGAGWSSCGVSGQTVSCTHAGAPIGPLMSAMTIPVVVNAPIGTASGPLSDTATAGSSDAVQGSGTDVVQYSAPPTATALVFGNEPANAQVNTTNPVNVTVDAEVTPGGAVDNTYNGPVTLSFANNPGNAKFGTGANPTSTIQTNAVAGVATFSSATTPVIVNAVGFGYTLQASAPNLAAATSTPFDVNAATATCTATQTCTVTTTSPTTNQSAQVQALPGAPGSPPATVTASFGGNVAPIHPCTGATAGILTFSGNRQKLITLTMTNLKLPVLLFCYGQPTPFKDITLRPTTFFNTVNQDYEGLLPLCLLVPNGPCVKSISLNLAKKSETVVISSGSADPHIMT